MRKIFAPLLGIASLHALAGAEPETKQEEAHQVPAITEKTSQPGSVRGRTARRRQSAGDGVPDHFLDRGSSLCETGGIVSDDERYPKQS